jgi:hypothetical protein
MKHIGIPGGGGALGECQICGNDFLLEIMMGQKVATFHLEECGDQTLYAHKRCLPLLKSGMKPEELPDKSPIRKAFQEAQQDSPCTPSTPS